MDIHELVGFYKKYIEPFIAIAVLLGLIYAGIMLNENYQAKKDIAAECGWGDEEVRCVCEKRDVITAEKLRYNEIGDIVLNVSLDK